MSIPRTARETVLRMLFQWDMTRESPEHVKSMYWQHAKADPPIPAMSDRLFDGIIERVEEIDNLIRPRIQRGNFDTLSAVDRNILRMGVGEMLTRPDISARIILSEAVEVAQDYASEQSADFINGVLDAVRRQLRGNEPEPDAPVPDAAEPSA